MATDLIRDRGRGPEIVGTRITVYNLLPYFLDPTATEEYICSVNKLAPEQVAAARAYVLNHADSVLAEHRKIEERLAVGNPPEVIAQAKETHARMLKFRDWLAAREQAAANQEAAESPRPDNPPRSAAFPTFKEWLAEQESPPAERH
jgi:uncharacterized protein (DUF433 family)